MQYELYIDVFFLTNFVMDYLALLAEKRVLRCAASRGGILVGALAGATGACLLVCIPMPPAVRFFCAHGVISAGMVWIGLNVKGGRAFAQAWILLYLTGFLWGGILGWLRQFVGGRFRFGILFLAAVIASWHLLSAGFSFLERFWKRGERLRAVTLYQGEKQIRINAIVDSGNELRDGLTGRPVHIIGRSALERLLGGGAMPMVRYIPYHTIQGGESLLPVLTIERMCLHGREDRVVTRPLLGVTGQQLGNGAYEMILHPEDC